MADQTTCAVSPTQTHDPQTTCQNLSTSGPFTVTTSDAGSTTAEDSSNPPTPASSDNTSDCAECDGSPTVPDLDPCQGETNEGPKEETKVDGCSESETKEQESGTGDGEDVEEGREEEVGKENTVHEDRIVAEKTEERVKMRMEERVEEKVEEKVEEEEDYEAQLQAENDRRARQEALDTVTSLLSKLVGFDKIKARFEELKYHVEHNKIVGINNPRQRFHAVFQGNPGTGKYLDLP